MDLESRWEGDRRQNWAKPSGSYVWGLARPSSGCDFARSPAGAPMILMCNQNWGPPRKKQQACSRSRSKNDGSTTEVRSSKALRRSCLSFALERKGSHGEVRTRNSETTHPSPTEETSWWREGPRLRRVGTTKTAWRGQMHSGSPRNGRSNSGETWWVCVSCTNKTGLEAGMKRTRFLSQLSHWLVVWPQSTLIVWLYSSSLKRDMFTLKGH